jgi:hypothetical protein
LGKRFELLFTRLGVVSTKDEVARTVNAIEIHKTPEDFGGKPLPAEDVTGLAD